MASYPTTSLQPGATGSAVKQLQDYLVSQGYMTQAQVNTGYGTYGPQTTAAVKALQQSLGVDNSSGPGYWGPRTIAGVSGTSSANSSGGATQVSQPAATSVVQPNSWYQPINGGQSQQQIDNLKLMDQYTKNNGGYTIAPDGTILPKNSVISPVEPKDTTGIPPVDTSSTSNSTPTLRPELVPGTPEYQAALDKLSTAYYDVMQTSLTATTGAEQAAAKTAWDQLRQYTQATLGFNLSGDATKAWDQINTLKSQGGEQGTVGSGIQQESIDDYLKSIRNTNAANRATSKNIIDKNQAAYYQQFATPSQVKALIDSNPDLARSYGLIPSDEIKNSMSFAALKAKYPSMSDSDINRYISTVLDENGNLRSDLYQKYMTGKNNEVDTGNVTPIYASYDPNTGAGVGEIISYGVKPSDTGMLDIGQAKQTYLNRNAPLGSPSNTSGAPIIQSPNTAAVTATNVANANNAVAPKAAPAPVVVPPQLTSSGSTNNSSTTPPTSSITPTPPATPTATTTPKKTYGTLYDYYTGTTGAYPTWNSTQRMADAQKAGISNYTGTADQNRLLLSYLQK